MYGHINDIIYISTLRCIDHNSQLWGHFDSCLLKDNRESLETQKHYQKPL